MEKACKTVLVTGALGVTGRMLCSHFKNHGYFVIASDRCSGTCDCHFFIQVDFNRLLLGEPPAMFTDFVRNVLGDRKLDLVINNAAIDSARELPEVTAETFRAVFECNVSSPLILTKALLGSMKDSATTFIYVTSSARRAHYASKVEYVASKYALMGVVKSLGMEYCDGFRFYGVGSADTSLIDKVDDGEGFAQRVCHAALMLVEDKKFMGSGEVIFI